MNHLATICALAVCLYFGVVHHVPYLTGIGTFGAVMFVLNRAE